MFLGLENRIHPTLIAPTKFACASTVTHSRQRDVDELAQKPGNKRRFHLGLFHFSEAIVPGCRSWLGPFDEKRRGFHFQHQ